MSHLNLGIFHQFLSELTCQVTLFDHKLQFFKKSPKWTIFGILINFCPLKLKIQLASLAILNETFSMIFKHCVKRATLENSKWPSSHILGKLIYKARRYIPIFWHQLSIPKGHQIFYICFKIQLAVTLPSATDARPPAVSSLRTKKSQIIIRKNCKKL